MHRPINFHKHNTYIMDAFLMELLSELLRMQISLFKWRALSAKTAGTGCFVLVALISVLSDLMTSMSVT